LIRPQGTLFLPFPLRGAASARVTDDNVRWVEVAEGRLRPGWPAEGGDRGCESLGLEALPCLLALPDVDDAEALVGRAGDVQDQAARGWFDHRGGDALVLFPARGDVLYEGVDHRSSFLSGFDQDGVEVGAYFVDLQVGGTVTAPTFDTFVRDHGVGREPPINIYGLPNWI